MKISLREKILTHLKGNYPNWVSGSDIEAFSMSEGKKGSNGSRRARELVNDGILERRETAKGWVEYRYVFQPNELPPARITEHKLTPLFHV